MPLEKLGLLEQQLTQMIDRIKNLQSQKNSLEAKVEQLTNQLQIMGQELEQKRQENINLTQLQEENQRFHEERGQVYAKLESMLKGLEEIQV